MEIFNIPKGNRILFEAELKPIQGERFQPTGFADVGAGTFVLPDGRRKLLVESVQSVANRMESALIGDDNRLKPEFEGLSYIHVQLTGESKSQTSSLVEAHRINSPFIISDESFRQKFCVAAEYEKGKLLDWKRIAKALFYYDINSLLHGVFLANLEDGRVKVARAVSGFIEADNVREAVSGGVKNNPLDPTGTLRAANYDKDVYGNVPYQRVEYTAEKIMAYFLIDLGLLRSYKLEPEAFELLVNLSLYKIQFFLSEGLRLRTACSFAVEGRIKVAEPDGMAIPSMEDLTLLIQRGIEKCRQKELLGESPLEIVTNTKIKKKENSPDKAAVAPSDSTE